MALPLTPIFLVLRSKTYLSSHETEPQFLRTNCRTSKFEEETDPFKKTYSSENQRQPEPGPLDVSRSLTYLGCLACPRRDLLVVCAATGNLTRKAPVLAKNLLREWKSRSKMLILCHWSQSLDTSLPANCY